MKIPRSNWNLAAIGWLLVSLAGTPALVVREEAAEPWNRFRGPNGAGVSRAAGIPVAWKAEDYLWQIDLPGTGHSSPISWEGKLFLTSGEEATGTRIVQCLRATDGKTLWMRRFLAEVHGKHKLNSFASATPVADAKHVYVCWATPKEFIVRALSHDGDDAWQVDLGAFRAGHGFGVSPIVFEDLLIVPNDQDGDSRIVALECATGAQRWEVPRRSAVSYSTPCVFQRKDAPAELILTDWTHGMTSLDPRTGELNWELDVFDKSHSETAIGSPIVAGDLMLGICGYLGHGNEVVAVRPPRGAEEKPQRVYRIDRGAPLCTTPVVKDGLVFLWTDVGIASCADATTGEILWQKRVGGNYYSSPICIGEFLYNISTDGEVIVLAADREYRRIAETPLGEGSHSTPAVVDGVLYLRTFSKLFALPGK